MKLLLTLSRQAKRYRAVYIVAILSTFALTIVNLTAPKLLSNMTAVVEAGGEGAAQQLVQLTLWLVALYFLRILFRFLSNYLSHMAAWNLVEAMRVKLYSHIQSFSMSFFSDKQTGDLMSRVVNDTANFEQLYAHLIPEMITNVVMVLGTLAILLTINVRLALLTLIPIPLIMAGGVFFAKKVRPNFRVMQKALGGLNARLQDSFSGIHEIQAFGQEQYEKEAVDNRANVFTRAMLRALKISGVFHPTVEFLSSIGTIIVVSAGGMLALRGQLSVSDIVAFLLYLALFYTPVSGLAQLLENAQSAMAGAERVVAILETPIDIVDEPGARDIESVSGKIEFEHVDFAYESGVPVVEDISFSVEPGQMVALVGPTGVGKTTLTQLIPRFYDPTAGRVKIDGIDVKEYTLKSLRRKIAPVRQDTFLFNGTIAENIRYAEPDASDDAVKEAAMAARIHEDIMAMPKQYETQVGERGTRLSGGQKQRIAIARAILRNSPIIILDEATASVDVETEQNIQSAILDLSGKRTVVAIAHRLSTVVRADLILVLKSGKIVERGTHESLIAQGGLYARLNKAQTFSVEE